MGPKVLLVESDLAIRMWAVPEDATPWSFNSKVMPAGLAGLSRKGAQL